MTSGIVSKIEDRAIISDVNINHGNSGGPLFSMDGVVLGITTFGDPDQGGPGISGIVRIDEARSAIAEAEGHLLDNAPTEDTLPVEPRMTYPLAALKETIAGRPVKVSDYQIAASVFNVTLMTPVLMYGVDYDARQAAMKERSKRNSKATSVQNTMDPFANFKNWASYVGEFRPVLIIDATPKLVEGFWSAVGRGLAESRGYYGGPANLHFNSDFYKMTLSCGDSPVTPIHPGKVAASRRRGERGAQGQ